MTDYSKSKFSGPVAEHLYALTLDGRGEEVGDVLTGGHFTLIAFDENDAEAVNDLLPADERTGRCCWFDNGPGRPDCITGFWGVVVSEDGQGFVDVILFPTSMEADETWNEIEHIHSADNQITEAHSA